MYNVTPMYGFAAPQPRARNTQPLTNEQIAALRKDSNTFNMKVSQEEVWKAICTHKDKTTGDYTLDNIGTDEKGSIWKCGICGKEFHFLDEISVERVDEIVKDMIDVLQTSKSIYLDAPEEMVRNYYQIIPLLEKLPYLWSQSLANFNKYVNNTNSPLAMSPNYANNFATLNNIIGGAWANPVMNNQYYQMPMMNVQPNNGWYQQQPAYDPNMMNGYPQTAPQQPPMNPWGGVPQQPPTNNGWTTGWGNPMAYNQPQVAPQQPTQAPPVGTVPEAKPAQAPQPQQAAPQQEVQQQQTFAV